MIDQSRVTAIVIALLTVGAFSFSACSDDMSVDSVGGEDMNTPSLRVAPAASASGHTYEVTIENLTSGQPFSPGVIATHTKKTNVFKAGEPASEGIRYIAEMGDPSVAVTELEGNADAHDVAATTSPVGPGGTLMTEIEGKANANRLSLAVMLVCTNDGFTGLESVKLPGGYKAETYEMMAYDAGTELNEETSETIVDGCGLGSDGNARTATDEPIMAHPGIQGTGDLTVADHGWTDPVIRITVQRMK